jgi:hypothetical protein
MAFEPAIKTPSYEEGQLFVDQVNYQTKENERQLNELNSLSPLVNTPESQRGVTKQFQGTAAAPGFYRQALQGAAAVGLQHSGTLAAIQAQTVQQEALARAQLQAQEEQTRLTRLQQAQGVVSTLRKANEEIPKHDVLRDGLPTYGRELGVTGFSPFGEEYLDDYQANEMSILHQQQAISALQKARPTEQQMVSNWGAEVSKIFDQRSPSIIARYKKMGASEDMLRGIQNSLDAEKQDAMDQVAVAARSLTGPDPAAASTTISNLFSPVNIQKIYNDGGWGDFQTALGVTAQMVRSGTKLGATIYGMPTDPRAKNTLNAASKF